MRKIARVGSRPDEEAATNPFEAAPAANGVRSRLLLHLAELTSDWERIVTLHLEKEQPAAALAALSGALTAGKLTVEALTRVLDAHAPALQEPTVFPRLEK